MSVAVVERVTESDSYMQVYGPTSVDHRKELHRPRPVL